RSRQRRLAVVDVTDRANVHVRLIPLKLTFCHSCFLEIKGRACQRMGPRRIAQPCRGFDAQAQAKSLRKDEGRQTVIRVVSTRNQDRDPDQKNPHAANALNNEFKLVR
ncbi:hypothetical protein M2360_003992, partial [Rhizobium sp. SG_E_25_P2]|nr:hypothetical protein [Rhizobium sp. SG_E_25_P2]